MSAFLFQPVQIGPLRVEWPVFLAPMAGYTDGAFRSLCLEQGCGAAVTEMVSAQGLMRDHQRTLRYLDTWGEEHVLGAQIYGSDPAVMAAGRAPRVPEVEEIRGMVREHLRREVELMARRGRRELKLGAELTACLVMRPHLVRYLRGFKGFGALARTLEERVDAATLLGRVDEVLATGRKGAEPGVLGGADPE